KNSAAARTWLASDQRRNFRINPPALQRGDNEFALPQTVGFILPVLQGAATAILEMLAGGRLTLRRCFQKRHNRRSVLVTRDIGHLARQRERHINLAVWKVGDAIAARTNRADCNLGRHRSFFPARRYSRLPSPPSIGDGQRPSA